MPAIAAVGGLDLVLVGLVVCILAVAFFPLFRPLVAGGLSQVPLIGAWLAGNAEIVLAAGYGSALAVVNASISPLADLLRRLRFALVLWTSWSVGVESALAVKLWSLRWQVLPAIEDTLIRYSQALYTSALVYAGALFDQAVRYAQALFGDAVRYALDLFGQALAYAQALQAASLAYAQALFSDAIRYVQAVAAQESAYAQALAQTEERYAQTLFGDSIRYTQEAVAGAEAYAGRVGVQAEGYARALDEVTARYAEQLAGQAMAYAQALAVPIAASVARIEDSPCQRACGPLGEIGGLLQDLEGAGILAVLLGLVDEVRRDPAAVQDVLREDVAPALRAAAGGLEAI